MNRIPSHLLVSGLVRAANACGGYAVLIKRGAEERGGIILICRENDRETHLLELTLDFNDKMLWLPHNSGNQGSTVDLDKYLAKRQAHDEDLWVVELSIADAQRFADELLELP